MDAKKTISIYQPVYFPWLGFFHKLILSDVYVVLDDCQAVKQSWMNRVMIKHGVDKGWLTVPIYTKHRSSQLVKDIEIDNRSNWGRKHLKVIQMHYAKTPFYAEIYEIAQLLLSKEYKYLADLNMDCICRIKNLLGISVDIVFSSELNYEPAQSTQRLMNIIKTLDGGVYVCGMGSGDYLEPGFFEDNGITLQFQRYESLEYSQVGKGEFMAGLSIIDTFANIGLDGVWDLVDRNKQ